MARENTTSVENRRQEKYENSLFQLKTTVRRTSKSLEKRAIPTRRFLPEVPTGGSGKWERIVFVATKNKGGLEKCEKFLPTPSGLVLFFLDLFFFPSISFYCFSLASSPPLHPGPMATACKITNIPRPPPARSFSTIYHARGCKRCYTPLEVVYIAGLLGVFVLRCTVCLRRYSVGECVADHLVGNDDLIVGSGCRRIWVYSNVEGGGKRSSFSSISSPQFFRCTKEYPYSDIPSLFSTS